MMICMGALCLFNGCDKDDEDAAANPLVGSWKYESAYVLLYLDGNVYDSRNMDIDTGLDFAGSTFTFTDDTWTISQGRSSESYAYTLNGNKIYADRLILEYSITGKSTLEIVFDTSDFEKLETVPDEFYEFDNVEIILTFKKS
jgi:hypothetical protein